MELTTANVLQLINNWKDLERWDVKLKQIERGWDGSKIFCKAFGFDKWYKNAHISWLYIGID